MKILKYLFDVIINMLTALNMRWCCSLKCLNFLLYLWVIYKAIARGSLFLVKVLKNQQHLMVKPQTIAWLQLYIIRLFQYWIWKIFNVFCSFYLGKLLKIATKNFVSSLDMFYRCFYPKFVTIQFLFYSYVLFILALIFNSLVK